MRLERTKNATRNMLFGFLLRFYQILMPFVIRTVMIYYLGIEYLGLNSLFTSVLQVLNLAELGVGNAMVYSMYKPIVEDDEEKICALMNLYRTYYRIIGLIIAVLGLAILPFIPHIIKDDIPADINIYVLYLFNLSATVFSYWLFAYKNCLLTAHQRTDVSSKVLLVTNTVQYILQILSICLAHNYYLFVISNLLIQIASNVCTALVVNKMFPRYNPKGNLSKIEISAINKKIRDLFTAKIGAVIVLSADTIVISAFLGLSALAIYQNYYYVINAIISIILIVFTSVTAGIGNSIITETKEKNFADLRKFTFIISWIAGVCACCFLNMFQPFMMIWVKKDELLLPFSAVICLVIYYFVFEINALLNTYKDAAGMWHEDRFRPLVTAVVNLGSNLVMVQFWGIYGVILSTVLSMLCVGMPWLIHNLFTTVFEKEHMTQYLKKIGFYTVTVVISCVISYWLCSYVNVSNHWLTLVLNMAISVVISNVLFLITYAKSQEFHDSLLLLNKMLGGRLNRFVKKGAD